MKKGCSVPTNYALLVTQEVYSKCTKLKYLNMASQQRRFKNSISRTLLAWFLLLALIPMTLVAYISYQKASSELYKVAVEHLENIADLDSQFIHNWFDFRFIDATQLASSSSTYHLLHLLIDGAKQSKQSLPDFLNSEKGLKIIAGREENLSSMKKNYTYISNLFLIDHNGKVLYSVDHKSNLGENLFLGQLKNTRFAKTVKVSLKNKIILFSDVEHYPHDSNILAGFIVCPVLNELGESEGVLAVQLKMDAIFSTIRGGDKPEQSMIRYVLDQAGVLWTILDYNPEEISVDQKASSLVHYIVGGDGLLRTEIKQNRHEVLNRKINTKQFNLWKDEHGILGKKNLNMQEEVVEYLGPDKVEVIGVHNAVHIQGINWVLISEINKSEALQAAFWLKKVMVLLVMITGLLVAILAVFQARRMTQPIAKLVRAVQAVERGDINQQVTVNVNNEIGVLADSFNTMLEVRRQQWESLKESNKTTQNALAELTEQKFALDQHAIISATDMKGKITLINDKFCEISGYSQDELIGQDHRLINSGKHNREFFKQMYKTIANGKVWHGEICNKAKDGSLYWVESTIVPRINKQGKLFGYIALRTETTKRKQVEIALYKAKENAEAANKTKGEFLANMSHEIRTPMNGVIGMTELLLDHPLDLEQQNRALTIKRSAESLLTIINDILDFSKMEAGKLDLEILEFNLGTLLEDVADTLAFRTIEKNLEFTCSVNPLLPQWFKGDPGRIRQILTNLIGNAIKFTEQGEVAVSYDFIQTANGQKVLRFAVKDTGIGLSVEQQGKLFKKFSQADSSTTRKFGGTGLGLAISKQLVELMGGKIDIESEPGKGSTFWFTLALEQAEDKTSAIKYHTLANENVLVVDDNKTNQVVFGQFLTAWKVPYDLASSGSEALQAMYDAVAKNKPYSIALIDMQMPGMDGAKLAEIMQSEAKFSDIRLAMLTSQGQRGDAKKMHKQGFSAYLSKPIHQSELYNALMQLSDMEFSPDSSELITRYTAKEQQVKFSVSILVVDDNSINQAVAKGMLGKFGIEIELANNGQEALDLLQRQIFDLVFMDCQMPVMDGYTATKNIRDSQSPVLNHTVPIVAMTANAMQGDKEKCLASGMDDFIAKPVSAVKLRLILEKWLSHKIVKARDSVFEVEVKDKTEEEVEGELVFDYPAISERLMGDKALIQTIVDAYLADMPLQIEQLKSFVQDENTAQAAAQAHKIKGASSNVGAMALAALAYKMEQAGKAGDITIIKQNLIELDHAFELLISTMTEIFT